MIDFLAALRLEIYRQWISSGSAPTAEELSAALGEDARPGLDRLAAAHTIVLDPGMYSIRMAHPFSGVPTAYRVASAGISYWANCAWDSLGIAAILGRDTESMAQCADCGERADLSVRGGTVCDEALIHMVVPARHFWDDIVFT